MSRKLYILIVTLICLALSAAVWADDAAEIEKIKGVLTAEEEAEWAGDVEKIKSFFAPDFVMCMPKGGTHIDRGWNKIMDPVHFEVSGSGADFVNEYAERYREYADYLKKNPEFVHGIVVEHVNVKGNAAIAVEKRIRGWPVDVETKREWARTNMRNIWILKKIDGTWKLSSCLAHFSMGQRVWKMRPPN